MTELDVHALTGRLDDAESLEAHLETTCVRDVLATTGDPCVSVTYYGAEDINLGSEEITADAFTLDAYRVSKTGLGEYTVRLRASTGRTLLPSADTEYGPGGHDIEVIEGEIVYKATAKFDSYGGHVDASVLAVPAV